jgi:hypothetical protein
MLEEEWIYINRGATSCRMPSGVRQPVCMPVVPAESTIKITPVFLAPVGALPDHLIRLEEEHWGYRDAERLGGLEVDHELEFDRPLNGEIGRQRPLQDFVGIRLRRDN